MKTHVDTSLFDDHFARMQLEELERVRFQKAGILEVYGKFGFIFAASIATLMVGFGMMMWLMTPEPSPVSDEHYL